MEFNFVELFAGIGAQKRALTELNINVNIKKSIISEWFIPAIKTYNLIHSFEQFNKFKSKELKNKLNKLNKLNFLKKFNLSFDSKNKINLNRFEKFNEEKLTDIYLHIKFSKEYYNNLFDIKNISGSSLIKSDIDCLTYSFPCQDLSIQGKQKGLKNGTKSKLIWEVSRILKEIKKIDKNKLPKMLLMENVSSILNKKHILQLEKFIKKLKELGYSSEYKSLKASDFGSYTIRKRTFMISKLNNKKINWPIELEIKKTKLNKILEKKPDEKYLIKNIKLNELNFKITKHGLKKASIPKGSEMFKNFNSENLVFHWEGLAPTLTATGALSRLKLVDKKNRIRYLTPLESWRLTDFKDKDFSKIKKIFSKNIQIFLVGNSIPVNLIKSVFKLNLNYEL